MLTTVAIGAAYGERLEPIEHALRELEVEQGVDEQRRTVADDSRRCSSPSRPSGWSQARQPSPTSVSDRVSKGMSWGPSATVPLVGGELDVLRAGQDLADQRVLVDRRTTSDQKVTSAALGFRSSRSP